MFIRNYKWVFVFDKNQTNKIEIVKNNFLLYKEENGSRNWKISFNWPSDGSVMT